SNEQILGLVVFTDAVVSNEIDFTARIGVAFDLNIHLSDQVLGAIAGGQKALGEVDELIGAAGKQPAVNVTVGMKGAFLHIRQQTVLAAHVVPQSLLNLLACLKASNFMGKIGKVYCCHGPSFSCGSV